MKRSLMALAALCLVSAAAFFGIRMVKSWNNSTVEEAVQKEQERWMMDVENLKSQVQELQQELANETPQENQAKKVSEILDTPEGIAHPAQNSLKGLHLLYLLYLEHE